MGKAKETDRRALSPCLTRRLAGLLLAGTVLAAPAVMAQEKTSATPTFQDPLTATATAANDTSTNTAAAADPFTDETTTASTPEEPALAAEDDVTPADIGEDGAYLSTGRRTERLNPRETNLGNVRSEFDDPYEPTGIRLGTFVLKPSISQGIGYEKTKSGDTSSSRTFSQTGLKGTLTSDWSRHQLTVEGEGIYQRNISGTGETEPKIDVNADLRLDLSDDTIADITGGYNFERESSSDPNAVNGASVQSGVHTFTAGAKVQRDFGLIRGTLGAELEREVYGAAELGNGDELDLSDRNNTEGTLTGRVGFELSPALIPYLEASVGRSYYDNEQDALGYERSASTIGGRAGVEVDLGEKLRGDLGIGYKRATFDDSRLAALEGITVDGAVFWSPQRGTDLRLGLATNLEPSTTAGQSGYVEYIATADLTHELRDNLVARLSGSYTWRDFSASAGLADQDVYLAGAGLTWDINRWLAVTGDISYELTRQPGGSDTGITRAGIGLVLRR